MKPKAFIPLLVVLLVLAGGTTRYLERSASRFDTDFTALEQELSEGDWAAVRVRVGRSVSTGGC